MLYISVTVALIIISSLILLLRYAKSSGREQPDGEAVGARRNQVVQQAPRRVAGVRGRPARNRLAAGAHAQDDSESDLSEADLDDVDIRQQYDGKIGTKKLRKLEEKAARKAQREAEAEERRERQERQEMLEKKKRKEEQQRQKEEAAKAAEEERLKEEQAQREHEEYLKLKEAFTVDEEGTDALEQQDAQSLLQEFISYIERLKVVMLEDLAAHFKIKTQDAIDRVKTLQLEGRLTGVVDDRGKFICITAAEYEAVARFIKQRGRVSISELASSMNQLIRLKPVDQPDDTCQSTPLAASQPDDTCQSTQLTATA